MNIASHSSWILNLNDSSSKFQSLDDFREAIASSAALQQCELSAFGDAGRRPFWHRLLGAERWLACYFILLWREDVASLAFYDENASEYRASDPSSAVKNDPKFNEVFPYNVSPLMAKERAFEAVKEFMKAGEKPAWLSYSYVR